MNLVSTKSLSHRAADDMQAMIRSCLDLAKVYEHQSASYIDLKLTSLFIRLANERSVIADELQQYLYVDLTNLDGVRTVAKPPADDGETNYLTTPAEQLAALQETADCENELLKLADRLLAETAELSINSVMIEVRKLLKTGSRRVHSLHDIWKYKSPF